MKEFMEEETEDSYKEVEFVCPICEKVVGDDWNRCICLYENSNE